MKAVRFIPLETYTPGGVDSDDWYLENGEFRRGGSCGTPNGERRLYRREEYDTDQVVNGIIVGGDLNNNQIWLSVDGKVFDQKAFRLKAKVELLLT